jgi:hypothetical protein
MQEIIVMEPKLGIYAGSVTVPAPDPNPDLGHI